MNWSCRKYAEYVLNIRQHQANYLLHRLFHILFDC